MATKAKKATKKAAKKKAAAEASADSRGRAPLGTGKKLYKVNGEPKLQEGKPRDLVYKSIKDGMKYETFIEKQDNPKLANDCLSNLMRRGFIEARAD